MIIDFLLDDIRKAIADIESEVSGLTGDAFASVDYVSSAKTIYFYNANNEAVGSIDTTDFVVDGMIDTVSLSGNVLHFVFNTDAGKQPIDVDLSSIMPALDEYWTSAETKSYVDSAVTAVEDHLFDVEEVTASALTELHDNVLELSARTVDLSGYYTSGETDAAISAATAGKADALNVQANTNHFIFPTWNNQGVISGVSQQVFKSYLVVNDGDAGGYFFMNSSRYDTQNKALKLYTPLSAGTAGEVLVSTGSGAPVWSAFTGNKTLVDFDKTSQAERASIYAELKALYDVGSGATINKTYDFYKSVNTWQGLKIDYYSFSGNTLVFGKVVSPENLTDQVVYEQVMTIDSAGNVNVVTNTVGGGGGDMSAYWTSAETKDYVDTAVSGIDLSNYYTKAETEDAISAATSGKADKAYVDSAITEVQDQIDTMDDVVSAALVDLNTRKVESTSVSTIWKGTQAEYDATTQSGATANPATLYIIVNNS